MLPDAVIENPTAKVNCLQCRQTHRNKLLNEVGEPYKTMVELIAAAGLRIDELLGLRWRALDLEVGTLAVRESGLAYEPAAEAFTLRPGGPVGVPVEHVGCGCLKATVCGVPLARLATTRIPWVNCPSSPYDKSSRNSENQTKPHVAKVNSNQMLGQLNVVHLKNPRSTDSSTSSPSTVRGSVSAD